MKRVVSTLKFVLAGLALCFLAPAAGAQSAPPLDVPLYFEGVKSQNEYLSSGSGYQFQISASGVQIALRDSGSRAATAEMTLAGANARAQIEGRGELPGKVNYLIGGDASQWQTGLPTFAQVRVMEIYPGINLVYHGNQQRLEYDFTLAPGANPGAIKMRFTGVDKISLTPRGELVLKIGGNEIRQPEPDIYQTFAGAQKTVRGGYKILDAQTVGFETGAYDSSAPLVIDPVLSYSSFFGGTTRNIGWAIALDTNTGDIYMAGQTLAKQFSTIGAVQTGFGGGTYIGDAFVAKFGNPATNLIYLTYLGGTNDDAALALAVDPAGDAFVAGYTQSTNFPVKNPLPGHNKISGKRSGLGTFFPDAFVAELGPGGSNLVYSTYLGGEAAEAANSIALDSADNAYVTGFTASTNFPITPGAFQDHLACSNNIFYNVNAFLSEITNGGGALVYSTYLGGRNFDVAKGVAVDTSSNVYVAGYTASYNFPVWNTPTNFPLLHFLNGRTNQSESRRFDGFVTKFPPLASQPSSLTNLVYSTFLGGSNDDEINGIAVDTNGDAFVTGWTASTNFPVLGTPAGLYSYLTTNGVRFPPVATNVFLTEISPDGSRLTNSTVFGAKRIDIGNKVALDAAGDIFIVGSEIYTNFPTTNSFGSLLGTNSLRFGGAYDAFVTAIKADWSSAYYSVLIGGNKNTFGNDLAVDLQTNVFITGLTSATNFPTQNASRFWFNGTNFINGTNYINGDRLSNKTNAFLAEIAFTSVTPLSLAVQPTNVTIGFGGTTNFSVTVNGAPGPFTYQWQTNGVNLKDGGNFRGTTSSTLTITNAQFRDSGTNYSVIVSYGPNQSLTASNITLTVSQYPVILVPLTNQTVAVGSTVTFNLVASGKPLFYGWLKNPTVAPYIPLKNSSHISGVTTGTLTIKDAQTNDTGQYYVLVATNPVIIDGELVSDYVDSPATLTVLPNLSIVTPPTNQTVAIGSTVIFSVTAVGNTPLHYSWLLNGAPLTNGPAFSGVTNSTLTITNVQTSEAGAYQVDISDDGGSTNVSAALTVLPNLTIVTPPTNQTVSVGSTVNFSITVVGNTSLFYSWLLNGTQLTNGSTFSGVTNSTLTIANVQMNNAGTYQVDVSDDGGSTNASAMLAVLLSPSFNFPARLGSSGLVLSGSGGSNDGTYFVLTSSNLATPLNLWTPIVTNQFDSQGRFNFTNQQTNLPAAFYILKEN